MVRTSLALGLVACALPAAALDCPAMPQQASRDTEVEVRVGVRGLGNASGVELTKKTRELTNELLSKLPNADRVYLEQMMYASYCSALKANAALAESEREQRVRLYVREMCAAVAPAVPPAPRVDRRDAARAELARLPVDYTADAFVAAAARGDMRVVNLFVATGFDVNAADHEQTTALAQAAARGDMPMLTTLLGAGARVGRVDTALSWAAYGRQPAALRALLAAQPGTDASKQAFIAAVRKGYVAGMELLRPNGVTWLPMVWMRWGRPRCSNARTTTPTPITSPLRPSWSIGACRWPAPTSRASRC